MDKRMQAIIREILITTAYIEENFPELQKYLDENRSTLPDGSNHIGKINEEDLNNYLNELREMVEKYKARH